MVLTVPGKMFDVRIACSDEIVKFKNKRGIVRSGALLYGNRTHGKK